MSLAFVTLMKPEPITGPWQVLPVAQIVTELMALMDRAGERVLGKFQRRPNIEDDRALTAQQLIKGDRGFGGQFRRRARRRGDRVFGWFQCHGG